MLEIKTKEELLNCSVFELRDIARKNNVYSSNLITQNDLISAILGVNQNKSKEQKTITEDDKREVYGILDIMQDGYGFLRTKNYEASEMEFEDIYVSTKQIKTFNLRKGDLVKVTAENKNVNLTKSVPAIDILSINNKNPQEALQRPYFDNLTPIYPDKRIKLENFNNSNDLAIRSIDLLAPIGKGQRALIVSPPKAGKTTLLKKIANAITSSNPKLKLMVLLVDERPEEVTDMQRSIKGDVIYSAFDELPEHHTKISELAIERAKRLVELGEDVVIIMDSLTRLARAYNLTVQLSGRTLSGGIDPASLYLPKRFFGAARNIEHGGSLTIIATALIDTGSRMDDVIYEEFKGTGNMEVHLDRKLSEKRIFPAIDLFRSGTRREDLLLDQEELEAIWKIRRMLSNNEQDSTEKLLDLLQKTKNNIEFIRQIQKIDLN